MATRLSTSFSRVLGIGAALLIVGCTAAEPPNPADDLQRQGDDLRQGGQFQEAIVLYEQAVEADPELAPAYLGLAISHSSLGNKEEAERFYLVAAAKNPADVPTKLNLAGFYYRGRNYERALQVLQEASDIAPEGDDATLIAGLWARVETAQVRATVRKTLIEALAENPDDETTAAQLADGYAKEAGDLLQAGNAREAIGVVQEGQSSVPEAHQAELYYVGAQGYNVLGDKPTATDWLDRAIELNETVPAYHLARAGFLIEGQEYDEALSELDRVIELAPTSEEAEFARIRQGDVARFQQVPEDQVEEYLEERRGKTPPAKKKKTPGGG